MGEDFEWVMVPKIKTNTGAKDAQFSKNDRQADHS
jgi:hypothetical protein